MADENDTSNGPIFRDINAEDDDQEITEIQSMCLNCEDQGVTRLFLTRIPFFREIVVSSFSCDECGYRNTELQPAAEIQNKGVIVKVLIDSVQDLNRQVVKTKTAVLKIPELHFEIPPAKGELSTVEGILMKSIEGLEHDQPIRKATSPEEYEKIEKFVETLGELKSGNSPFHLIVDDPSGNSFIENPLAPSADPHITTTHYKRTREQNEMLGLQTGDVQQDNTEIASGDRQQENKENTHQGELGKLFDAKDEVAVFHAECPGCGANCQTKMVVIDIPHFKETVIMATECDHCGYRDNEVKGGGGIEPKGRRIKLKIATAEDLKRDVLKTATCCTKIPELKFESGLGSECGKLTTVEGLLTSLREELDRNPFLRNDGDSSRDEMKEKVKRFCTVLDDMCEGKQFGYHVILDDPAGNCYIQNPNAPEPDPLLQIEDYDRDFEENESLGINDMITENYGST